jgi:hypothetical protein
MRSLWILALVFGCASPKAWEPRPRGAGWDARPLDWLLVQQNPDGSWGEDSSPVEGLAVGRIGVTSFALEAISAYGFSHFSKDVRNGRTVGSDLRRGLDWLISLLETDGTFRGALPGGLDQAIGACALLDNYAMTADDRVKVPASSALSALMKMRRSDGAWDTPLLTAFSIGALASARMAELPYDARALEEAGDLMCDEFRGRPDWINACIPPIRYRRDGKWEHRLESLEWVAARAPDSARLDFPAWLLGSGVIYANSGSGESVWRRWTEGLEKSVESLVSCDGQWPGPDRNSSIVRTAIIGLCHAAYQGSRRFESVFSSQK